MPDPRHPESDTHHIDGLGMQHLRLSASRKQSATKRLLNRHTGRPHTASAGPTHTCATHNYERGMTLWGVQKFHGSDWATMTVRYMATCLLSQDTA